MESRKKEAAYASMISCKRVMEEEACIAFCDPAELLDSNGNMIPPHLLPERIRRAISIEVKETRGPSGIGKSTEYKYTLLDKKASLEKISKHLGLYERDNLQKAVKIYFMSHGDEGAPEAEIIPEIEKKKPRMITSNQPVALTE
jgi:phage terminase small subunit